VNTPERTTAAAFPRYLHGRVLADSAELQWSGLYARRFLCHRVVDWLLVPATAEPLIACALAGSAEFREREVGGMWVTQYIRRGDLFVTRSKTPYEVSTRSSVGEELESVHVHVAVEPFLAALKAVHAGNADEIEAVVDFAGAMRRSRTCATRAQQCFRCARWEAPGASPT
jgi:AraC family transcriptional regulator